MQPLEDKCQLGSLWSLARQTGGEKDSGARLPPKLLWQLPQAGSCPTGEELVEEGRFLIMSVCVFQVGGPLVTVCVGFRPAPQ